MVLVYLKQDSGVMTTEEHVFKWKDFKEELTDPEDGGALSSEHGISVFETDIKIEYAHARNSNPRDETDREVFNLSEVGDIKVEDNCVFDESNGRNMETQVDNKHVKNANNSLACNDKITTQIKLKEHLSIFKTDTEIHTQEKNLSCVKCGAEFLHERTLVSHLLRHAKKRHYSCNTCGMTFKMKNGLTLHMKSHNADRPYSCDVCGMTFKVRHGLKGHMSVHSKERPYRCNVCTATFQVKYALTSHMKIHTNEIPFSCNVSGQHL